MDELDALLTKIASELIAAGEADLAASAEILKNAQDAGFEQVRQLLEQIFTARGYPVGRLDWFPQAQDAQGWPKTQRLLEQILRISRGSWRTWAQLSAAIRAASAQVPEYAAFERLQALRRTQLNPRWRVQQEENSLAGREYKNRAIAAAQEIQRLLIGLVFDDPRAQNAAAVVQSKVRAIISGFETLPGRQIARQLSIIQQYLEPVVGRGDFVKDGPNKQQVLAHNAEVLNRFRALTEALGYRRGAETQRF